MQAAPRAEGNHALEFAVRRAKEHDRPWGERPVFGTVRSMTASGLRRKFDADAYVCRVEALETARN